MAFAREIILQILQNIRFRVPQKGERDSYYTILGNTLVRVSNHCTYMYVWDNYFEKNPKHKGMNIVSLVFEDNGNTATTDGLVLKRSRNSPIVVNEYVFPCHGNGQYINKNDIKTIISDLLNIGKTNIYKDNTSKSRYFKRVSINPTSQNISMNQNGNQIFTPNSNNTNWGYGIDSVSENKQYKTNVNMKQIVKLTESDLHKVIKESVKKILQENDFTPHGYKATSAFGGYEVQLDDRGENARLRNSYDGTITDWLEIQFDENGVAYVIDENGEEERLCDYMRY